MKLQNFVLVQASAPSITSFLYSPPKSTRWGDTNTNTNTNTKFVCKLVLFSHVKSRKSLSRIQPCCCGSRFFEDFGEEEFYGQGIDEIFSRNEGCCAIFESVNSRNGIVLPTKFEYLEPYMLGIEPEPPYCWPEREAILCTIIEQKAKSSGLPLSLQMIKKKQKRWEYSSFKDLKEDDSCTTSKAFANLVFIIIELQTQAMHMRETICDKDLEKIISKVQGQMYTSFVWLFRQVFSQTPTLMMYVMILLANYSVYSTSQVIAMAIDQETTRRSIDETHSKQHGKVMSHIVLEKPSDLSVQELRNDEEIELWDSIEAEALNMRGLRDIGLEHEIMLKFVSPLSVEIEPDSNDHYFKTDVIYQVALKYEPDNTLLLCNYAQFLKVIARDYNRSEECFKRAMEIEPPDAEVLCQYANFLWTVRKDLLGAEERYQQALAVDPRNPYYTYTYANFLWSTGGEETCFPASSTSSISHRQGEEV